MRQINSVFVHCSASKPSQEVDIEVIRGWHLTRGFNDVGYHYVITRTGEVQKGRDEEVVGAHAKGYNTNSVGICLVGGLNEKGTPDANFTFAQYRALKYLISDLQMRYGMDLEIKGHREVANKACPCFDIHGFLEYT
jgi:N-acetyl-anhydromuramyl-L-alanine amidase AmpD